MLIPFEMFFSPCTSGSVIPEENADEFITPSDIPMNGIRMGSSSGSLSLPIQSQHQQSYRTESPQSAYSPYGNSPVIDQPNHAGYMMMSPGNDFNRGYMSKFIIFFLAKTQLFIHPNLDVNVKTECMGDTAKRRV